MSLTSRTQTKILITLNALMALALFGWAMSNFQSDFDTSSSSSGESISDFSPIARQAIQTDAIEAHPLFSSTRLPVRIVPPTDKPDSETSQTPPLLVGVLRYGDGQIGGLLEDPQSGTRKFIRHGEDFIGWTLISFRSKTAVIRSGSREIELHLSFDSRSSEKPESSNPAPPVPRNP